MIYYAKALVARNGCETIENETNHTTLYNKTITLNKQIITDLSIFAKNIILKDIIYSDNVIFLNDEVKLITTLMPNEEHEANMPSKDIINLTNEKQSIEEIKNELNRKVVLNSLIADMKEIEQKLHKKQIDNDETEINSKTELNEHRGGKYNKKIAPLPPLCDNQTNENKSMSTIKATLVLKPGLLKPVGSQLQDRNNRRSEVFVQSPKLKRKINKSPSPSRMKTDSAFTKLLMFSKRMGVRFKELDYDINKRKSWHNILNSDSSSLTRQQSKSDDNISLNVQKESTLR